MSKANHKLKEFVGAAISRPNFEGISKKEIGITLIALIITIVVTLILVAVTLSVTLGENGLVNKAKLASEEKQRGIDKEILMSAVVGAIGIDGKVDFTYLDSHLPEGFTESNGTYTSKHGNTFTVSESGKITYVGKGDISEDENIPDDNIIEEPEQPEEPEEPEEPEQPVIPNPLMGVGDVITGYKPTNYTSSNPYTVSLAGCSGSFYTEDLTWTVKAVEGNTITMMANSSTTNSLSLTGANGWNNSITALDDICTKLYGGTTEKYTATARSVRFEDVGITGTPTNSTYTTSSDGTNNKLPVSYLEEYHNITNVSEDTAGCGYASYPNITVTNTSYISTDQSLKGLNYWVAKKCVVATSSDSASFSIGHVGSQTEATVFDTAGTSSTASYKIKPVVELTISDWSCLTTSDGGANWFMDSNGIIPYETTIEFSHDGTEENMKTWIVVNEDETAGTIDIVLPTGIESFTVGKTDPIAIENAVDLDGDNTVEDFEIAIYSWNHLPEYVDTFFEEFSANLPSNAKSYEKNFTIKYYESEIFDGALSEFDILNYDFSIEYRAHTIYEALETDIEWTSRGYPYFSDGLYGFEFVNMGAGPKYGYELKACSFIVISGDLSASGRTGCDSQIITLFPTVTIEIE